MNEVCAVTDIRVKSISHIYPYSTISYYNVKDRRFDQSLISGRKLEKFMNTRIINILSSYHGHCRWSWLVAMFATYDSGTQFTDTGSSKFQEVRLRSPSARAPVVSTNCDEG